MKNCFSYLAKDAAYVFITGYITRVVKVLHDRVEAASYFLIFFQITASKLRIILTEDQWLLGLKRRLVVQTLGMTAPPPGLEEQHQHMRNESKVPFLDLWGHDELSLNPGRVVFFFPWVIWLIKEKSAFVRVPALRHHQSVSVAQRRWGIFSKSLRCPHLIPLSCSFIQPGGPTRETARVTQAVPASHLSASWPAL